MISEEHMKKELGTVCPVVNVPFDSHGDIDFPGLNAVIDYTLNQGIDSLCLFAFNSEPHKMTDAEKRRVIPAFLQAVAGRAFTVVGLIENSLRGCMELAKLAEDNGCDALILYPPSAGTPAAPALMDFFRKIASSTPLPVMLQDNPRSTGVTMSADFLANLRKTIPNFRYLKVECPMPTAKIRQLTSLFSAEELMCLSGNGGIHAVDAWLCGARGLMPGVCTAGRFAEMYRLMVGNRIGEARDLFEKLLPLVWYEDQSLEFYIACEKAILKREGVIACEDSRDPGVKLDAPQKKELFTLYDRLK